MTGPAFAVVIPTLGRPSLATLLQSLAAQAVQPDQLVVVDDRPTRPPSPALDVPPTARVVTTGGRGPAAARNAGWRTCATLAGDPAPWVVFVDDDVLLPADWSQRLQGDLQVAGPDVGGVQGRVQVPLPDDRRPTDWERGTAGLQEAVWITADMAYRREALERVGGFDERFPRAFREDADLALRVQRAGYRLTHGRRLVVHPVRPSDPWASLRQQRGNADDALMRRLHGPGWTTQAQAPRGRLPGHLATVACATLGLGALATGHRRTGLLAATAWAGLTAEFAWRRIAPGPRTRDEVRAMTLTSLLIPFAAVAHRLAGSVRHRRAQPWPPASSAPPSTTPAVRPVRAVLFDRDGTLVHDVPYNADPSQVAPVDGAAQALQRLRDNGIALGVITNQSGVGRGLLTADDVAAVNDRVERELGPIGTWQVCPHAPDDGCDCRKPQPALVRRAADALGVETHEVVVVGDIGSDVEAARAAGARAILVPTDATLPAEVTTAPTVARTLGEAVDVILGGRS